jgi:hypothetical protein
MFKLYELGAFNVVPLSSDHKFDSEKSLGECSRAIAAGAL